MASAVYPFSRLGSEFMPPLYEGTLFYMPVTIPAASISEVSKLLNLQDKLIMTVPEVQQVFGKAGRADTPTDPAPLEMFETIINLKPEPQWRPGMTVDRLTDELNDKLSIPGVANSFTMPIKARIDMLATGIRTPVGIKVLGPDLKVIEKIGIKLEDAIRPIKGTRSVYAERSTTGYFLDFKVKREEAARYGLSIDDVQEVIQSAIGGASLTTTIEGRERYPVNVRYSRGLRSSIESLKQVLIPVIPLTLFIIFILLYFNTTSITKTMIVLLAVPFSLVGSFWLLYFLNYNMSIAVWIGIIALAGLDAETGVVMLLYLDLAYTQWKQEGRLTNLADLKEAIMHGAVKRIRPKIMTVSVILAGLVPIMFSSGTGADVMKRIAAPMVGGVATSTILELLIYPAIFLLWKQRGIRQTGAIPDTTDPEVANRDSLPSKS